MQSSKRIFSVRRRGAPGRLYLSGMVVFTALFLLQTTAAPFPPQDAAMQPGQQISAQQLDDLVAPIALYPDPLLGEVLAASTYPMEIAEAEQWVLDHPHWKPSKIMDEAKKQN